MWCEFLKTQQNIDFENDNVEKISDNIFVVDAVHNESQLELFYIVCDYSIPKYSFVYDELIKVLDDFCSYQPIFVFEDWTHERQVLRQQLIDFRSRKDKKAKDIKVLELLFAQKMSLYSNVSDEVVFNVKDNGVNYLEYSVHKNSNNELNGLIYNVSFYELKKLFNVTGTQLFKNNVRYGIAKNALGDTLRLKFKEYILSSIYRQVVAMNIEPNLLSEIQDLILSSCGCDEIEKMATAENFWFYHNGISIYSFGKINTQSNQIIINPKEVSVINGAQTITNFYTMLELIEDTVVKELHNLLEANEKININSILEEVNVKVIFLEGRKALIAPVTYGLNTQIPIQKETIMADSNEVLEINNLLIGKVRILKDGEGYYSGINLKPIDFIKAWLVITDAPGKSKNFTKKELETTIKQILNKLKESSDKGQIDYYINKFILLDEIYKWWDKTKKIRLNTADTNEETNICAYGKNYFGSFALNVLEHKNVEFNEEVIVSVFDLFLNELLNIDGYDFIVNDFKKDDLANNLLSNMNYQVKTLDHLNENDRLELIKLLNRNDQSAYTYSKTINSYLNVKGSMLEDFRVVSLVNFKLKEAFPYPNSSFNELLEGEYLEFKDSKFAFEIEKTYPLFVINKRLKQGNDKVYEVEDINLIQEFSFKEYKEEAEEVYNRVVEAFEVGDEYLFPKMSDKLDFHIRPKAKNAEDVFEFTNGQNITKRTFWANKDTVTDIISKYLPPGFKE